MSESLSEDDVSMRLRDNPAVASKNDYFQIDPRKLKVDENYNVRDMSSKETRDHIAGLKSSIGANGVKIPLEVRIDDKSVFVVAGHCRLAAVLQLIAEGVEIETVPCFPEGKGTSEIDRTVNLVISNSGKALAPLELAKVVKRLVDYGWNAKQIAERLGWKSKASVEQHLEMLELPEPVKDHVRKGEISATLARNIAKGVDPEEAEELIRANLEENRRIKGSGKGNVRVTPKSMKRDAKPKSKPPVEDQEPMHAEPQSLPATESAAPVVQSSSPSVVATPAQPLSGIPENRVEPPAIDAERDQGVVQLAPPQSRNGLKELIDALLPFARMSEINDLNERHDDEALEISVRDIKRAASAWFKATGLTTTGNGEHSEAA